MENKSMNSEIAKYETMGKYIKFKRSTKLKITK